MYRTTKIYLGLLMVIILASCSQKNELKVGSYRAELIINKEQNLTIPWLMNIEQSEEKYKALIINGEEQIEIKNIVLKDDSVIFQLPVFQSEIRSILTENGLEGRWIDRSKNNTSMPIKATHGVDSRFDKKSSDKMEYIMGSYEVKFHNNENSFNAIGKFLQNKQGLVRGTFMTTTGDYRYLSGIMDGKELKLSTFDGAHAYLFTATKEGNDLVNGKFYSNDKLAYSWEGLKTDDIELTDPKELTYLKDKRQKLTFSFDDLNGNTINYPSAQFDDKVLIVQIMGSWCPNCMDESEYFSKLYREYHDKGLEILAVAFERGEDQSKILKAIEHFKSSLGVPYPIVYGGNANKAAASEAFPMFNEIQAFPTSIIIDRKGEIRQIHTGFNGPGTGKIFEEYSKDTELFISKLIQNKI